MAISAGVTLSQEILQVRIYRYSSRLESVLLASGFKLNNKADYKPRYLMVKGDYKQISRCFYYTNTMENMFIFDGTFSQIMSRDLLIPSPVYLGYPSYEPPIS